MTIQEQNIAKAVGLSVGLFPSEVASLLNDNGVVLDAQNLNSDQLVDAVYTGLHTSSSFNTQWVEFLKTHSEELSNY